MGCIFLGLDRSEQLRVLPAKELVQSMNGTYSGLDPIDLRHALINMLFDICPNGRPLHSWDFEGPTVPFPLAVVQQRRELMEILCQSERKTWAFRFKKR